MKMCIRRRNLDLSMWSFLFLIPTPCMVTYMYRDRYKSNYQSLGLYYLDFKKELLVFRLQRNKLHSSFLSFECQGKHWKDD